MFRAGTGWRALWAGVLVAGAALGAGCRGLNTKATPVEVDIADRAPSVDIELARSLPLVPVRINGMGPYWMLLDTGSDETVLDDDVAVEVGLVTEDRFAIVSSGGHTRRMNTPQGRLREITIGETAFRDFDVVAHDLSELGRTLRHRLDGIIGVQVLAQSIVTIDYPAKKVRFDRGRLPAADGALRVPMIWSGSEAIVRVRIGGREFSAKLDTGQVGALSLSERDRDALRELLTSRGTITHRTFTGSVERDVVRVEGRMRLGDLEIENPYASIGGRTRVGSGALRRSVVRIDLAAGVLEVVAPDGPVRTRWFD